MSKDDLQKNFKKSDLGKSSIQSVESFYVYRINIIADLRKQSPRTLHMQKCLEQTLNAGEH